VDFLRNQHFRQVQFALAENENNPNIKWFSIYLNSYFLGYFHFFIKSVPLTCSAHPEKTLPYSSSTSGISPDSTMSINAFTRGRIMVVKQWSQDNPLLATGLAVRAVLASIGFPQIAHLVMSFIIGT
jgi:hypothetical protein